MEKKYDKIKENIMMLKVLKENKLKDITDMEKNLYVAQQLNTFVLILILK